MSILKNIRVRVWHILHILIFCLAARWLYSGAPVFLVLLGVGCPWLLVHGTQVCHDHIELPALNKWQVVAGITFFTAATWGWALLFFPPDYTGTHFFAFFPLVTLSAAALLTFFLKMKNAYTSEHCFSSNTTDDDADDDVVSVSLLTNSAVSPFETSMLWR
jgi:hypothetical protein